MLRLGNLVEAPLCTDIGIPWSYAGAVHSESPMHHADPIDHHTTVCKAKAKAETALCTCLRDTREIVFNATGRLLVEAVEA